MRLYRFDCHDVFVLTGEQVVVLGWAGSARKLRRMIEGTRRKTA